MSPLLHAFVLLFYVVQNLFCGEAGGHLPEGRGLHAQVFLRRGGGEGRGGGGRGGRGGQWRTSPPLRGGRAQQRVEIQSPFQCGAASHGRGGAGRGLRRAGERGARGLGERGGGDGSSRPSPEAPSPPSGADGGGELRQGLRLLPIALSRERLRPPRRLLRRRIRSPPAPPSRIPPPAVPGAVAGTVGAELGSARRLGAADEKRWQRRRQRFPL